MALEANPVKHLSTAALILAAAPMLAQQTGVAHPPDVVDEIPAAQVAAPSADTSVPVVTAPVIVVPAKPTPIDGRETSAGNETRYESPAVTLKHRDIEKFDPDAEIVTSVPVNPHELPEGTLIRARLKQNIETATTAQGTRFTAELTEPVKHMGRVVMPVGSVVEGRVTEIRGGRRFRGAAMIHLQAQQVVLPDGSRISLNASVVDSDQFANNKIDDEGNIIRKDHAKETVAAMSLATGGAAAAGGVIGGGVGALVGAGIGAGVSTVWWLKQDRQTQMPADALLVLSLNAPLPIESLVREPDFSKAPVAPLRERKSASVTGEISEARPAAAAQSYVPAN